MEGRDAAPTLTMTHAGNGGGVRCVSMTTQPALVHGCAAEVGKRACGEPPIVSFPLLLPGSSTHARLGAAWLGNRRRADLKNTVRPVLFTGLNFQAIGSRVAALEDVCVAV